MPADPTAPLTPEELEYRAGKMLVESARLRSERMGPDDVHEMRHLLAAVEAGNTDGEEPGACPLDAVARHREQADAEVARLKARVTELEKDLAVFTTDPGILTRVGEGHTRYWYDQTRLADAEVARAQRLRSGLIEVIRLSPDSPGAEYAKKVLSECAATRPPTPSLPAGAPGYPGRATCRACAYESQRRWRSRRAWWGWTGANAGRHR